MAPSWAVMAPLSSAEPRPKSRPSRRVSFHGGDPSSRADVVDRLHVVMGVEEHGRFAGSAEPFAVGVGIGIAALQDLDVLQTGRASARRSGRPSGRFRLCSPSVLMLGTATRSARSLTRYVVIGLQPIENGSVDGHGRSPPDVCTARLWSLWQLRKRSEGMIWKGIPAARAGKPRSSRAASLERKTRLPITAAVMLARSTAPAAMSRQGQASSRAVSSRQTEQRFDGAVEHLGSRTMPMLPDQQTPFRRLAAKDEGRRPQPGR